MDGFEKYFSFSGVVGAVDDCHMPIKTPENKDNLDLYMNKKNSPLWFRRMYVTSNSGFYLFTQDDHAFAMVLVFSEIQACSESRINGFGRSTF